MNDPHASQSPSPWVARFAHLIPAGARVLDYACGHGRHARYLAARGCAVVAVDRDELALAPLHAVRGVTVRTLDLEGSAWPLAGEAFDAIVVANYLHRPRLAELLATLKPTGILLYETFAVGNESYGRPSNPAFLLRPGELLDVVARGGRPLAVVAFEEGHIEGPARRAVVQRIAAVGPAHPWPLSLLPDTSPAQGG
jgi:SAM-dependent methyltransferase